MTAYVTLLCASRSLGVHKDTLRKQILAGTCPYPYRRDAEGRWLVCLPQNAAETVQNATHTDASDLIGDLRADMEYALTETRRELLAVIERQARTIAGLNAAVNDLTEQRERDRAEVVRVGQVAGAYRAVETREERGRTMTGESSRAACTGRIGGFAGMLGRLVGQRG